MGATIFVRSAAVGSNDGSAWDSAFVDLQDALFTAEPGDEIWIAAGIYKPDRGTGDREATFELVNGVAIYGGFGGWETGRGQRDSTANETILSGDLNGDDGSFNCGATSNCCVGHLGAGCDDQSCQEKVCDLFPHCCEDLRVARGSGVYWSCETFAGIVCCELSAGSCENSVHVVTGTELDSTTVLDGVTISGGRADGGPDFDLQDMDGGGALIRGGSPKFTNCVFRGNSGFGSGGMFLSTSSAVLDGCTFTDNLAFQGAGLFLSTGAPQLTDCVFASNIGGGIFSAPDPNSDSPGPYLSNCLFRENSRAPAFENRREKATFSHCTFVRNAFGAIRTRFDGEAVLSNCTFVGNSTDISVSSGRIAATNCHFLGSTFHGVNLSSSVGIFANCLFSGSTGQAVIEVSFGGLHAVNCTVVGNVSRGSAIVLGTSGVAKIENCILWGNSSRQFVGPANLGGLPENIQINHTLFEGWTGEFGGIGNFDADPLLLDADGFDNIPGTLDDRLELSEGSPAVDAGNRLALIADAQDLDGDGDTNEPIPFDLAGLPRIQNKAVDLGAYEGGHQMIVTDTDELSVPEGGVASFQVSLLRSPQTLGPRGMTKVAVMISEGDSDVTVLRGHALNFHEGNYAIPQIVTIAAAPDIDLVNGWATVRLSGAGIALARVNVREIDTDAVPPILLVDRHAKGRNIGTSWPDALNELSDALALGKDRAGVSEIWVATGTYTPDTTSQDREAAFELLNGVAVYGGFAGWESQRDQRDWRKNRTVLSGDLEGNDEGNPGGTAENSRHVLTATDVDSSTVLDGFTVTGGNGEGSGNGNGSGLLVTSGAPTISNCVFSENFSGDGGAVKLQRQSAPVFRNCVFRNNTALFVGGAISGNSDDETTLINCLIAGNIAAFRNTGAVAVTAKLRNCTVVQNDTLLGEFGGVAAIADVKNSIIWSNRAANKITESTNLYGLIRIDYSTVEGWSGRGGGVGNTGDAPMFVDPIGPDGIEGTGDEDFRLSIESPLINRGDPGYDPDFDETDLQGDPRIAGCRLDLGAFETDVFQATGDFDGDELHTLSDYAGFQNCFQAETTNPEWEQACLCVFDWNGDKSLDLNDFLAFQALLAGP